MKDIILASNSSRRKNLLEMLNVPFTVIESGVNERVEEENYKEQGIEHTPYEWVKAIAGIKAETVARTAGANKIIIAADTIVTYLGKIVHRPFEKEHAMQMLKMLSGHKHTVYTGLAVMYVDEEENIVMNKMVSSTDVYMRNLTEQEIEAYVDTKEPYYKAGGYGIQAKGSLLVDHIDGDFYTVVGLPLAMLYEELRKNGVDIMDFWK